jgi:hypothetical protein
VTDDEVLAMVLWSSIEDYQGLWEPEWELATAEPDAPADERLRRVRTAVRDLFDRGWIEVLRTLEPSGPATRLEGAEALAALDDERSWHPVAFGENAIRISATPEGLQAYDRIGSTPRPTTSD